MLLMKESCISVAFRVDASIHIGTGHVMRCLTLADALRGLGAHSLFICRAHLGHLAEQIAARGHEVHLLSPPVALPVTGSDTGSKLAHAHWLGVTPDQDSEETQDLLNARRVDWLIVDHYALDATWEAKVRKTCHKVMVLDDLADRSHLADVLLDQTFSRAATDYAGLIGSGCRLLCGTDYALLRKDFVTYRDFSLERRRKARFGVRHLLVNMGGVDSNNVSGQVLEALRDCELPADVRVTVVLGATAPGLAELRALAGEMPFRVDVKVNVAEMATLMAASDLAIGAAGSTSWERCCLGLPTLMLVLADNQRLVASGLQAAGAVSLLPGTENIARALPRALDTLISTPGTLAGMSDRAAALVDGAGVERVVEVIKRITWPEP